VSEKYPAAARNQSTKMSETSCKQCNRIYMCLMLKEEWHSSIIKKIKWRKQTRCR